MGQTVSSIPILAVSEKFKNIEAQCEEQMTKLKNIEGTFYLNLCCILQYESYLCFSKPRQY